MALRCRACSQPSARGTTSQAGRHEKRWSTWCCGNLKSKVHTIFARSGYTEPEKVLARYITPISVLLWELGELEFAIAEDDPQDEVVPAGGWSVADSLARSFLANGKGDVVLVVDADSSDPDQIMARKHFLEHSLGSIASRARSLVVVVVPELEALLFHDKALLEALVKRPVTESEFIRGKYEPKKVLRELLGGVPLNEAFRTRLPALDLEAVRQLAPLLELRDFISGNRAEAAAA